MRAARSLVSAAFVGSWLLVAPFAPTQAEVKARDVTVNYAAIAQAAYEDSLSTARQLAASIERLTASPSSETLAEARKAWLAERVPCMQTEAFRFGNKIVDDWEGKVNAWPLDEGLIDYVDTSYGTTSESNRLFTANVIANKSLLINGRKVDASRITKKLLSDTLHEAEKVEANVATGYHAIEFLLWGQDLNGTGPGAGQRPAIDFDVSRRQPRRLRQLGRRRSVGRDRGADIVARRMRRAARRCERSPHLDTQGRRHFLHRFVAGPRRLRCHLRHR